MVPRPGATPDADALVGSDTLSQRGRSLLQQIITETDHDALLFTHANSELPQLFAAVRDLIRTGDLPFRPIHMLDLLHLPRPSSQRYNRSRIAALLKWLGKTGITPDEQDLTVAAMEERAQSTVLTHLTGSMRIAAIGSAYALPPHEWQTTLAAIKNTANSNSGEPVFVLGSPQFSTARQLEMETRGLHMVGDDQDWGDPLVEAWADSPTTLDALSDPSRLTPRMLLPASVRLEKISARMDTLKTNRAVIVQSMGDEAVAWDTGYFQRALTARGFAVDLITPTQAPQPSAETSTALPKKPTVGQRSRKTLNSVASFGAFQRNWFKELREKVLAGTSLAVVNANSPQEILRAMDLPFVVNQWWASIVAAKQQSNRYFHLLRDHGYPSDAEAYSAQGIAATFDHDELLAPWGGLPRPAFVQAPLGSDATPRIFEHWARETGADLFLFERSIETRLDFPIDWWDSMATRWDSVLEEERINLMVAELEMLIQRIEANTDRRFDKEKFSEIMELINSQENYYRMTRDLIAAAHPAPVSIVDTMPATMVPQWHRGTAWARDAARDFYNEVRARHESGASACPSEKLRLMWVGRGMWNDMAFYQRWEASHGAVFIWSMYLSLAADGYIRSTANGQDPMRALAARFITMGDELRMPTWAGAWHVREAMSHGVDGAVALNDADPFVLRALRRAGIPVLSLNIDNYNHEASDTGAVDRQIVAFLEGPAHTFAASRKRAGQPLHRRAEHQRQGIGVDDL
jgi:hypothetical protein